MEEEERLCADGHSNPADAAFCVTCGRPLDPHGISESPAAPADEPVTPAMVDAAPLGAPGLSSDPAGLGARGGFVAGASKKRILKASGIGATALLVILGGAFLLLTAGVPDVAKMTAAKAQQAITGAGFAIGPTTKEFSQTVPRGSVVSQDPAGGSRARKGQQISLMVSRGPAVVVPDLSGVDITSAQSTLADLKVGVDSEREISETVPEGAVVRQQPAPGTRVEQESVVSLVVSAGPPTTTVTVTASLSDLVLEYDWLSCSTSVSLWSVTYQDSTIVNRSGKDLSTLSGRWEADPSNGYYFPCNVVGTFPDTPTNEEEYRVELGSTDSGNADWFTRAELEATGWSMKYR